MLDEAGTRQVSCALGSTRASKGRRLQYGVPVAAPTLAWARGDAGEEAPRLKLSLQVVVQLVALLPLGQLPLHVGALLLVLLRT